MFQQNSLSETRIQLKTRAIYNVIEEQLSWEQKLSIGKYNETVEEILYWNFNMRKGRYTYDARFEEGEGGGVRQKWDVIGRRGLGVGIASVLDVQS